jgi:hypothetical protein
MSSSISSSLVNIDRVCDYVPVVSTVSAIVNLFLKIVFIPINKYQENLDQYIVHIKDKSIFRSIILMVPVLGNLVAFILFNDHSAPNQNQDDQSSSEPTDQNVGGADALSSSHANDVPEQKIEKEKEDNLPSESASLNQTPPSPKNQSNNKPSSSVPEAPLANSFVQVPSRPASPTPSDSSGETVNEEPSPVIPVQHLQVNGADIASVEPQSGSDSESETQSTAPAAQPGQIGGMDASYVHINPFEEKKEQPIEVLAKFPLLKSLGFTEEQFVLIKPWISDDVELSESNLIKVFCSLEANLKAATAEKLKLSHLGISESLITCNFNKQIIFQKIKENELLKNDFCYALNAISKSPHLYDSFSDDIKNNPLVILLTMHFHSEKFNYPLFAQDLKKNADFGLLAVSLKSNFYNKLDDEVKKDPRIQKYMELNPMSPIKPKSRK